MHEGAIERGRPDVESRELKVESEHPLLSTFDFQLFNFSTFNGFSPPPSFADHLDQHPLAPLAIEFSVVHLLPGAEVELAVRDRE